MTLPIRQLPIHAFLGDQESNESITLAAVHSSGGSLNIWMDTYGAIGPILGFTEQNATPVVSSPNDNDAGGDPLTLVGLYLFSVFQNVSGEMRAIQQLIGVFFGFVTVLDGGGNPVTSAYQEIHYSDDLGATWTLIPSVSTGGQTPSGYTDILSFTPSFSQIGDLLVITGPTRTPLRWDGTTLAAMTAALSAAPAIADNGAGRLNGHYTWKVIVVLTDGTRQPDYETSLLTTLLDRQVTLTWTASANPLFKSYEVYRTTGADVVYFRAGETTALTFDDNVADIDLILDRTLQEHGDDPPFAAVCALHKSRMFYGNVFSALGAPDFPRKVAYSDPGRPDSVYLDKNFFDCSERDSMGDFLTGITGDWNDRAVFWLDRSVWTLAGDGRFVGAVVNWDLKRTKAKTGAVNGRSVIAVPAGAKFTDQRGEFQTTNQASLAYFTPQGDIRLFDGDNDLQISWPVNKTLSRFTFASRHYVVAYLDDVRKEIEWHVPADGEQFPSIVVAWNYKHGCWFIRERAFASLLVVATRQQQSVILGGGTDSGVCYLLWDGHSFNGAAFTSQWMSKSLYGLARQGEMEQGGEIFSFTKRFRWLEALFRVTGPLGLEIAWLPQEALDTATPVATTELLVGADAIVSADGSTIVSADLSELVVAEVGTGVIRRALLMDADGDYFHGRGIRLRIRASSP